MLWAYDYASTYKSKNITVGSTSTVAEYNIAQCGDNGVPLAEYTTGLDLSREKANVGGSGVVVAFGIQTEINGASFSIQEANIQALLGRIL